MVYFYFKIHNRFTLELPLPTSDNIQTNKFFIKQREFDKILLKIQYNSINTFVNFTKDNSIILVCFSI